MTDAQQEGESLGVLGEPLTEDLKYHYSPVSSDCMACAARVTSRKYKELEIQKCGIICGPFPSSEDVCRLPEAIAREKYRSTQLHVVTTNRRVKVFGKWTEQKLLAVVTDRLLQRASSVPPHPYEKIPPVRIELLSTSVPYDPIIHRGIYSESVLRKLYFSGASESVVIRAMKFGLRHLKPEDLNYFVQFGVSMSVLRSRTLWNDLIDESLVTSLRTMSFDEKASRKIILSGMLGQNEVCLMQLMLAGVDIPGILNWQGSTIEVGVRMTQFLRKLGVREDVLQLVVQKGIDEETHEMLKDLGYTETEEEEHLGMHEVVVCECDLTILESEVSVVVPQTSDNNSSKSLVSKLDDNQAGIEARETCACFFNTNSFLHSSSTSGRSNLVICKDIQSSQKFSRDSALLVDRNDYLRRTVLVPLVWAMAKALQYRPSDPKHYIACQLVRWRYGGVGETEMKKSEEYVVAKTIEMDNKLKEQERKDEQERIAKYEAETFKNIPCHPCWERQQIHRVNERCWQCVKKWVPNYEPCELQEICSSCKVDLSDILNSDSSTTNGGNSLTIASGFKDEKVISKDRESFLSLYENSYAEGMEFPSYHRNLCEESFQSDSFADSITESGSLSDKSNKSVDSKNVSPAT